MREKDAEKTMGNDSGFGYSFSIRIGSLDQSNMILNG